VVLSKAITVPPEKRIDANVPNACMHRKKGRIQEAIVVVEKKIISWPVESHRRPTLVEVASCGNMGVHHLLYAPGMPRCRISSLE